VPEVLKEECVRLDAERRGLLLELERLGSEIGDLRSRSVSPTGPRTSLVEFATAYPDLDLVERKRLMALPVAGIVVEACDQVNGEAPAGAGASEGDMRTRAYRASILLAAKPCGPTGANQTRLVRSGEVAGSPPGRPTEAWRSGAPGWGPTPDGPRGSRFRASLAAEGGAQEDQGSRPADDPLGADPRAACPCTRTPRPTAPRFPSVSVVRPWPREPFGLLTLELAPPKVVNW